MNQWHHFLFCLRRAAYGLIERPNDFASYLLAIAICNLLLYFAFYIIMKVCALVFICLDLHYVLYIWSKIMCVFSCGAVRESSVWR